MGTEEESGLTSPSPTTVKPSSSRESIISTGENNNNIHNNVLEEALQTALRDIDVKGVQAVVQQGLSIKYTILDQKRFRNALHVLVTSFTAFDRLHRPSNLKVRFIDILTILTKNGLDINETDFSNQTPLHLACCVLGHADIIKVLLASGIQVDKQDKFSQTALHKTAIYGGIHEVEALIDGGTNPNLFDVSGYSPLHLAIKYRNSHDVIEALVKYGCDINSQKLSHLVQGPTPLHLAIKKSTASTVRLLLKLGARADLKESSGQTCLHLAAANDITGSITAALIETRAHVNVQDDFLSETPLHKAIKARILDNIRLLVRWNANVNQQDDLGDTPLHKAAEYCDIIVAWTLLMKANGNIYIKNREGYPPYQKATKCNNKVALSVMKQFEEHGAIHS